jgi:hypothetical protein
MRRALTARPATAFQFILNWAAQTCSSDERRDRGSTECEIPVFHKLFLVLAPATGVLFVDLHGGLGVEC